MSDNRTRPTQSLSRREAIHRGVAGAAGLVVLGNAGKALAAPTCAATVSQTEGPYWVDEMLNRSDIRPDPATGVVQAGLPLRLALNVSEIQAGACSPVAGCYVDIWHCNAAGAYSDEPAGAGNPNTLGQKWLRGYQVTDAHGNVRFLTVYPGWYNGRTVHIHFRVRKFTGSTVTFNFASQVYFSDAITNAIYARTAPYNTRLSRSPATNTADGIYNPALLMRLADNGSHVLASYDVVINAVPGLIAAGPGPVPTPTDDDSLDHLHDFGGGTPPFRTA